MRWSVCSDCFAVGNNEGFVLNGVFTRVTLLNRFKRKKFNLKSDVMKPDETSQVLSVSLMLVLNQVLLQKQNVLTKTQTLIPDY